MLEVRSRPILTSSFSRLEDFTPATGSAYLYASSGEERSAHSPSWEATARDVQFCRVIDQSPAELAVGLGDEQMLVSLRSMRSLGQLVARVHERIVYLDITGLAHHVWAPLLRALIASGREVRVVYVEPGEYRYSPTPTEGEIFDLSERIQGIAPLPGFATLSSPVDSSIFVPMLGFEGTRLRFVVEEVQPSAHDIIPLIGVPGFKPEYPFHTYYGNRITLSETRSWQNVRYARANCPFSAMYVLADIAAQHPGQMLKIAPIGTKPHALGAVLYFLRTDGQVELVYDHPIRKPTRTGGSDRVSVYHVSSIPFSPAKVGQLVTLERRA